MFLGSRTVPERCEGLSKFQRDRRYHHRAVIDLARSPNFGPRKYGGVPSFVVIHYTAMATVEDAINRLCDPVYEVSAHYVIAKTGEVTQLVDDDMRAWHAGAGEWLGVTDINSWSIGIELDNEGAAPFAEPLMRALELLLAQILNRFSIPPQNVLGHSDVAPGRKRDPGPKFDWARITRMGLTAQAGQQPGSLSSFRERAQALGYSAKADDIDLLTAVRHRWRPSATGPLAPEDIACLPTPLTEKTLAP